MTHISSKFIAHDPHSCTYMGSEKGHHWCYWWCIWMDLIFSSLFGTRHGWMANQMVGKLHMEPKHCQFQQQHQHLYNVLHVSNGRFCSANFCPHPLNMLRASEQRWNHLDFFKHGLYQRIPGDDQPLCFPVYLVLYPIVWKQEFVQLNMKPEVHQWSLKKRWNHVKQPFLCKPQGPQLLSGATRRAATLVIPEHAPVLILPYFFTYPNCELLDFTYPNLIIFARQEIAHAKGN